MGRLDGAFGYDFRGNMPMRVRNAEDIFTQALCERLQDVTIESRDTLLDLLTRLQVKWMLTMYSYDKI